VSDQSPRPNPAYWMFTPISAFGATLVGVVVLFYGELGLLGEVVGTERVCGNAECGLGVGVWLIVSAFFVLVAAFLVGIVLGAVRRSDTPRLGVAVRRGLIVGGWCTLAYLLASVVIWWPKG
jgi:hypothetical protein